MGSVAFRSPYFPSSPARQGATISKRTIRLAVRDWDYVTPLVLGEVDQSALRDRDIDLEVHRVPSLPDLTDPTGPSFDAAEVSLSRYCTSVGAGDDRVVARPHFLMQTFRHRCVIVRSDSPYTSVEELRGRVIGLTGWQDSGNTWTRALLADHGVGIDDARWVVGRLTDSHPDTDRLQGYGKRGLIDQAPPGATLTGLLSDGSLDAVMTPFMPPDFFDHESPWRTLLPDVPAAEIAYAQRKGFVPGIHLLGFTSGLAATDPDLTMIISDLLVESRRLWLERRRKYADTSAWLLMDLRREAHELPVGWDDRGLDRQAPMINEFLDEQRRQGLTDHSPSLADLFPLDPGSAARTLSPTQEIA